jgi:threonine dehydrogenase-like Zn-dependent dehydrogenase
LVNTSNSWSDWEFAIKTIGSNGVIVNLGFPGRGDGLPTFNPLDPQYLYTKNLTIKSLCPLYEIDILPAHIRFNLKRNLEYIISLLKTKKISMTHLVSEEIKYDELKSQYIKYLSKKDFLLSTIINWKN